MPNQLLEYEAPPSHKSYSTKEKLWSRAQTKKAHVRIETAHRLLLILKTSGLLKLGASSSLNQMLASVKEGKHLWQDENFEHHLPPPPPPTKPLVDESTQNFATISRNPRFKRAHSMRMVDDVGSRCLTVFVMHPNPVQTGKIQDENNSSPGAPVVRARRLEFSKRAHLIRYLVRIHIGYGISITHTRH